MSEITMDQVVETFDECLEYVYGRRGGRDSQFKDDVDTAQEWIDEGVTLFMCSIVFYEQMSYMHERYLKYQDRQNVPHSLKIFDAQIKTAISHADHGKMDQGEIEESRWKARLYGFQVTGKWDENMWGPSPLSNKCRAPKRLLTEI